MLYGALGTVLLGPAGAEIIAWILMFGWGGLLFYQPFPVFGYGRPTWPLEPLVFPMLLVVAWPGGFPPWIASLLYLAGYLYARTLGRSLLRAWFGC